MRTRRWCDARNGVAGSVDALAVEALDGERLLTVGTFALQPMR